MSNSRLQMLFRFFTVLTGQLLIVMLTASSISAQVATSGADQSRLIPRDRLLTDAELLGILTIDQPPTGDAAAATQSLRDYFKNRAGANYFFDSGTAASRAKQFAKTYPQAAREIQKRVTEFIAAYGPDVGWKMPGKDLYGRPHTANTIRYLARQARAVDIAVCYYLNGGDRDYSDFLKSQIRDFIKDYQAGQTESGRNDVFERFYAGHRTRNWLFAYQLLRDSGVYNADDHIYMLKVFLLHGARLIDVCENFHWGNHQLHGLAGLFEMSTMYPDLPVMVYWQKEALRVIMEHISQEIKPDGFQFERASHYFKLDILNYFRIRKIAELNEQPLPPLFHQRFRSMFDAIDALARPDKSLPVLQDAQETYNKQLVAAEAQQQALSSNDAAELADPDERQFMSLGALVFDNSQYRYYGLEKFPPDFYWYFSRESITAYNNIEIKEPAGKSVALHDSKYFVMRSGIKANDLYMVIDGGLAQYKPDHTHGGILGMTAFAFGEEILPGYRVRYSDPSYRTMKNSLVKNVALADGVLQGQDWISNHARTGFGIWDKLPEPQINSWLSGEAFDYFSGSHNAYDSLGIDYQRRIVFFKPACWLVIDQFKSDQLHEYQQIWQGDYKIDHQYNRAHSTGKSAQLYILQADPARMEIRSRQNFWTNSVEFEKQGVKNYTFYTLLLPLDKSNSTAPDIRRYERKNYLQIVATSGEESYILYRRRGPHLTLDEIDTDGKWVLVSYRNNLAAAAALVGGSSLKMAGIDFKSNNPGSFEFSLSADESVAVSMLEGENSQIMINGNSSTLKMPQ